VDRLNRISMFVTVVDTGGFAGAARMLSISPPAVIRVINELEAHLGVRLLTRTTRVVRVTEDGERYAQDCKRILSKLAEADDSVSGRHGSPRGRLTLTAPALLGAKFVTPIVTEYLTRYPDVTASCWFLDRVVNLMDEGVDIAVRIGELPDSSMQAARVGQVRRLICAAPSYLEQYDIPQTPDDLSSHYIVSSSPVTPIAEWRLVESGEPRIVKLHPRMITTTNDSEVAAAVSEFGLTRLLSHQVAAQLRDGQLKTVLTEFESPGIPVHLVHREGRHASQKARAFLDLALERLRSNPALN
jgi:DNA-binding transcriptional LysR family regulator